jgi:hypothetical protein
MTAFDLINIYQFNYTSTKYLSGLPLDCCPCQYVYLCAGAMDGAKALLGRNNLKFREPTKVFEPYFGTCPSIFIEDILCIFKDSFSTLPSVKLKDILKKGNCVFKAVTTPTII